MEVKYFTFQELKEAMAALALSGAQLEGSAENPLPQALETECTTGAPCHAERKGWAVPRQLREAMAALALSGEQPEGSAENALELVISETGGAPPNAMTVIASPNSVTPGTSALSCFAQSWPPRMGVLQDASADSTTAYETPRPSWSQQYSVCIHPKKGVSDTFLESPLGKLFKWQP